MSKTCDGFSRKDPMKYIVQGLWQFVSKSHSLSVCVGERRATTEESASLTLQDKHVDRIICDYLKYSLSSLQSFKYYWRDYDSERTECFIVSAKLSASNHWELLNPREQNPDILVSWEHHSTLQSLSRNEDISSSVSISRKTNNRHNLNKGLEKQTNTIIESLEEKEWLLDSVLTKETSESHTRPQNKWMMMRGSKRYKKIHERVLPLFSSLLSYANS
jgi:hypothetical protein